MTAPARVGPYGNGDNSQHWEGVCDLSWTLTEYRTGVYCLPTKRRQRIWYKGQPITYDRWHFHSRSRNIVHRGNEIALIGDRRVVFLDMQTLAETRSVPTRAISTNLGEWMTGGTQGQDTQAGRICVYWDDSDRIWLRNSGDGGRMDVIALGDVPGTPQKTTTRANQRAYLALADGNRTICKPPSGHQSAVLQAVSLEEGAPQSWGRVSQCVSNWTTLSDSDAHYTIGPLALDQWGRTIGGIQVNKLVPGVRGPAWTWSDPTIVPADAGHFCMSPQPFAADQDYLYIVGLQRGNRGRDDARTGQVIAINKLSGKEFGLRDGPLSMPNVPRLTISDQRIGYIAYDRIGVYGGWSSRLGDASFDSRKLETQGRVTEPYEDHICSDLEYLYRVRLTCVPDNPGGEWVPPKLLVERYEIGDGSRTVRQFRLSGLWAGCKVDDVAIADGALFVLVCPRLPVSKTDGETLLVKIL